MENPAKISFTNNDILMGCSKFPKVTELTANRDCVNTGLESVNYR